MTLSSFWQTRLQRIDLPAPARARPACLPLNRSYYANRLTFVDDEAGAEALLDFAQQLRLARVGIDTEFAFTRPPTELPDNKLVTDPRSTKPLLLSITLVEAMPSPAVTEQRYEFVIDLRAKPVYGAVARLLRLPTTFIGHFLQAEFFCLWAAGLPVPGRVWDTWVTEKTAYLGRHHVQYRSPPVLVKRRRSKRWTKPSGPNGSGST